MPPLLLLYQHPPAPVTLLCLPPCHPQVASHNPLSAPLPFSSSLTPSLPSLMNSHEIVSSGNEAVNDLLSFYRFRLDEFEKERELHLERLETVSKFTKSGTTDGHPSPIYERLRPHLSNHVPPLPPLTPLQLRRRTSSTASAGKRRLATRSSLTSGRPCRTRRSRCIRSGRLRMTR